MDSISRLRANAFLVRRTQTARPFRVFWLDRFVRCARKKKTIPPIYENPKKSSKASRKVLETTKASKKKTVIWPKVSRKVLKASMLITKASRKLLKATKSQHRFFKSHAPNAKSDEKPVFSFHVSRSEC